MVLMRPEARALGNALLSQHRETTTRHPPGARVRPDRYTIRYGVLCERARVPHLVRSVGPFLVEVAEWCEAEGFPPLHALAVGQAGMPSDGYDGAGGFRMIDWATDVETCIRFTGYPAAIP